MNISQNKRNSSIEALRIIAMLFIVTHHYSVHGILNHYEMSFGLNQLIIQFSVLGNLGVVIFIIISGYFLIDSHFKLYKLIKLELQVLTYSILFLILFICTGNVNINVKDILQSIFPTIFEHYWFFTCYIVLYIFTPFINKYIKNLNKKEFQLNIAICILLWIIIPTFTTKTLGGTEICQFLLFYMLGAYLKKYPMPIKQKKMIGWIMTLAGFSLMFLSSLTFDILAEHISIFFIKGGTFFNTRWR